MRILLLEHPRSIAPDRCNDIANTPLSSCLISGYVAGMLRSRGHEAEILEGYLDRLGYAEIEARIREYAPDMLGVHMVYHWRQDLELSEFLSRLKRHKVASHMLAYGFYATISPGNIMGQCPAVDAVILGEAEAPFAAVAESLAAGSGIPPVPGLAVRSVSGGCEINNPEPVRDLDTIPYPVRTEALYRLPEVNILGSRGCYGSCTFCYVNAYHGRGLPWRGRSPENIAQEIASIISTTGKRNFYFTDPNFFGPGQQGQERALRIASLLEPMNIHFGIEGRVNDIRDLTIAALARAGLRNILIGLESGRDEALRRMNKMTTVAQNEEALRVLRRHGIEPNVGFIMFEPDSSLEDIRMNFEFLRRNGLLKNLSVTANVLYHHQIVLEGTEAYNSLRRQGRLELQGSVYEGSASFSSTDVSVLAEIMRQITNFLFLRMESIWSGSAVDLPGARKRYEEVNRLLVAAFEEVLCSLERGNMLSEAEASLIIENVRSGIEAALTI